MLTCMLAEANELCKAMKMVLKHTQQMLNGQLCGYANVWIANLQICEFVDWTSHRLDSS